MGNRFGELTFTEAVKAEQERHGSLRQYQRMAQTGAAGDRLGEVEASFLRGRDSFYMGLVTEDGWPYVQHRGGNPGFLRVLDEWTIGFADLRGNKQYISVGNPKKNDRVALLLMDYPMQARLKILGRAKIYEGDETAERWINRLVDAEEKTPAERAIVIHVEAFDWNCPQHITPRYTEAEILRVTQPMRERLEKAETENARLRDALQAAGAA